MRSAKAERTQTLVSAGALAARELDLARNTVASADAQLADARSRLVTAEKQLSDAVIRAPISGIVASRAVNAGDVVTPGAELFTVVDPSSMRLEASVPSESLSELRVGAAVTFQVRGYAAAVHRATGANRSADRLGYAPASHFRVHSERGRPARGRLVRRRAGRDAVGVGPGRAGERCQHRRGLTLGAARRRRKAERVDVALGLRDPRTERVHRNVRSRGGGHGASRRRSGHRARHARSGWRHRVTSGLFTCSSRISPSSVRSSPIVSMLALSVFGVVALLQLDTDEFPEIDAPIVVIAIPYPGASPDVVEREVIEPIEEVISGISGVDRMQSSSLDSFGNIVVEFVFEKDPQQATQEIRDEISTIRNDLPAEMEEPILTRVDPNDQPIVSLTLSSPALSGAELTRMVDPDITRRLRTISGVAEVESGRRHRARTGRGDSAAGDAGLWRERRAGSCRRCSRRTSPRLSGGSKADLDERTIRLKRTSRLPSDFAQLVVSESNGRDRASRRRGADPRRHRRSPGRSLFTTPRRRSGSTSSSRAGSARRRLRSRFEAKSSRIQQTLPAGVTLRVVRDAGVRVEASVRACRRRCSRAPR